MDLTLAMLAVVRAMIARGNWTPAYQEKLQRIECYLCERATRD